MLYNYLILAKLGQDLLREAHQDEKRYKDDCINQSAPVQVLTAQAKLIRTEGLAGKGFQSAIHAHQWLKYHHIE